MWGRLWISFCNFSGWVGEDLPNFSKASDISLNHWLKVLLASVNSINFWFILLFMISMFDANCCWVVASDMQHCLNSVNVFECSRALCWSSWTAEVSSLARCVVEGTYIVGVTRTVASLYVVGVLRGIATAASCCTDVAGSISVACRFIIGV